jgi:succinate dehydrogenase/fumarate reductase flavoprotein subunit
MRAHRIGRNASSVKLSPAREQFSICAIPGLFAVGNDAASIFGGSYPGAEATLGPAMTFGYICGRYVAASADGSAQDRR